MMMRPILPIATAAVAASAMYLFDPSEGRRRRALLRDQLASGADNLNDAAGVTWRDTRNRLRGFTWGMRRRLTGDGVDDSVLIERVRAHLGRAASHPRAVHVFAEDGCVTLRGAILERERRAVLRAVRSTPGVFEVIDCLHGFASGADIPSLQGGRDRRQLSEWRQSNWSPAMRMASGIASVSLLALGAARRGPAGLAAAAAGSLLLLRTARNEPLREQGEELREAIGPQLERARARRRFLPGMRSAAFRGSLQ